MRKLRAFFSILFATTLLLSSIGFSVSRHYCLGMLAEESFYHLGSESCGMTQDACDTTDNQMSTHCCEDQNLSIPGIQVQNRIGEDDADIAENSDSLPSCSVTEIDIDARFKNAIGFVPHAPPEGHHPSGKDILIHYQRFLI